VTALSLDSENFHSLRTRILSKAISYHPGPAGGHFLKHTCSIQQETFPALALPHYRSQGQVQSRHFQADVLGESRHLALVERWRCASVLQYGYDRARIHGFVMCDCGWGIMTSRMQKWLIALLFVLSTKSIIDTVPRLVSGIMSP
jgi:hypothetical protein